MLAAIKDDEFIHLNLCHTALTSGQLNSFSHASDQLNIGNSPTTKQPQHSPSTLSTNQGTLPTTLSNWAYMSRRKRPRTPTPGNYLGMKSSRESSYRGDRGRHRGGYGHDDYGYRRSPRRSPYRGGRDYSPRRSPYGGRSRRERSRTPPYSSYSPERGYGRRPNVYAR
ncbi:hypothetical protein NE237_018644 [Protea cynaroides]|uniref:Uncharacterized protein n=1 Tax=Protea cynaroides TaxID=273540 RepID=A0A9Q0QP75_9MAGN|nr:hypothetical protein NE237_018644 [Protea cynaroides]